MLAFEFYSYFLIVVFDGSYCALYHLIWKERAVCFVFHCFVTCAVRSACFFFFFFFFFFFLSFFLLPLGVFGRLYSVNMALAGQLFYYFDPLK